MTFRWRSTNSTMTSKTRKTNSRSRRLGLNSLTPAVEALEFRHLMSATNPLTSTVATGGTSFLNNPGGYLTGPSNDTPENIARNFLSSHAQELGVTSADVANLEVTDATPGSNGLTNVYLRQRYQGISIIDGIANVSITSDGRVLSAGLKLIDNVASRVSFGSPVLSAQDAVFRVSSRAGLSAPTALSMIRATGGVTRETYFADSGISRDEIPARLRYQLDTDGSLRLTWNVVVNMPNSADWFDFYVDARTGTEVSRYNWTHYVTEGVQASITAESALVSTIQNGLSRGTPVFTNYAQGTAASNAGTGTYAVFPLPYESPLSGPRISVTDVADAYASPYGWHDTNGVIGPEYTDTRGNNVFAQEDRNGDDTGGVRPDGGAGLVFTPVFDLTQNPTNANQVQSAITNLFYLNNVLHDIHYHYGFDEASGNFQFNNYGNGGSGNDPVIADAIDNYDPFINPYFIIPGSRDNANFQTPPDGFSGRMQMYVWDLTQPNRNGEFDNGIVIHEYGHGVSTRLTGGPANSNALNAYQSRAMGEGWSDFYTLMFTQRADDLAWDYFPVGTYALGQDNDPPEGIRRDPYSFDYSVNPRNYGDVGGNKYVGDTNEHPNGEVWASALWDLNLILCDKYGFSPDLYYGTGGNNLTMRLVMDAMKLQPSNPSFLDGRDAILAADIAITGGANQKEIWSAFARRGMGLSANDGGSSASRNITPAFDTPYADDIGSDAATARVIKNFSASAGTIESIGDQDYFKIPLEAGKQYTFRTVSGTLLDTSMTLIRPDGITEIVTNDNALPLSSSEIKYTPTTSGDYFLRVSVGAAVPLETGTYELQVYGSAPPTIVAPTPNGNYTTNSPAVYLDPVFTISDADTTNFARGKLTVRISSNASTFDRLEVVNQGTGAGLIGITGNNLTFSGVSIGTIIGGSTDKTIYFNGNATQEAVQSLMRNLTFRTIGSSPSTARRSIQIQLIDGDGGQSNTIVKNIGIVLASASLAPLDSVFAEGGV